MGGGINSGVYFSVVCSAFLSLWVVWFLFNGNISEFNDGGMGLCLVFVCDVVGYTVCSEV